MSKEDGKTLELRPGQASVVVAALPLFISAWKLTDDETLRAWAVWERLYESGADDEGSTYLSVDEWEWSAIKRSVDLLASHAPSSQVRAACEAVARMGAVP